MLSEQEVDRAAIAAYSRYRELSPNRRIETVEWVYLNEHDRNDWRDSAQAAVEAVLAQRTEPAPAQEQLGRDRTDEWESRMDAQKQAAQAVPQSAGNNSSGAEQINVPQCTAPVQQSVGAEDVVKRMLDAWYGDSEGFLPYDELQRVHMTAALAEARKGLHSEAEIEKALQDEVEQWPGYESWYKCFTKDVLARLNAHKEERVTVEKEMR
jgi:hypothetical protein